MSIDCLQTENQVVSPSDLFKSKANIKSQDLYTQAKEDRLTFWESQAQNLNWFTPWKQTLDWQKPFAKWFVGGQLNAAYNCLDVHLDSPTKNKTAIIWEGENGDVKRLTYEDLHAKVCQLASALKTKFKVKKGDRITLYMPMISELAIAVLACARIGAIHSVIFGGFSAKSVKDRIIDSQSKLVITADGGYRRGKVVPLKAIVDEALAEDSIGVETVLVVKHVGLKNALAHPERDIDYATAIASEKPDCDAEVMESEDPLFILYTSGTTGKPKGILHSTGGYLTHAKYSTKAVFDLKDEDVYWCTADIGWITGHTYFVYGPLANGATCLMFEGTPDYPDKDRFWELVERHKVSILYTAPTAIRAFMKWGTHLPKSHDLTSLRLLGTVGEPINPEAWLWYYENIGNKKCPIVDTWWQTETGGIMISNIPGANEMKPGLAGLPLPGVSAAILDIKGKPVKDGGGYLSLTEPWPSMARGIWGDNERFKEVYWSKFDTYFAGDGATIDDDGYIKVLGRVDDVLNVAGHRIGTMEVESSLVDYDGVAEAAVVGVTDEIKGQAIVAFVTLKQGVLTSEALNKALIRHVASDIGAIAKPKKVVFTQDLPKTRSGKIMRRLLGDIANGKQTGDTTTLANPDIVDEIKLAFT